MIQPAFCLELPTAWFAEILWKVNVLKMSNLWLADSMTDWTEEPGKRRFYSQLCDSFWCVYISSLCFFSHLPPLLLLKTVSSSEPKPASTVYLYLVWHAEAQVPVVVPVCCWNINNKPLFSFTNSKSASFDTFLVVLSYFTRSLRHFREHMQALPTSYPTDVRTEPQRLQLSLGWGITRNKVGLVPDGLSVATGAVVVKTFL